MRKIAYILVFVVCIGVCMLIGCGSKKNSSLGILPTKIEGIEKKDGKRTGGKAAKGCEAKEHEKGKYDPEWLTGSWVLEDEEAIKNLDKAETIQYVDKFNGETEKVEALCFPKEITFGEFDSLPDLENQCDKIAGICAGKATYLSTEDQSELREKKILYDISKNTLAIGITELGMSLLEDDEFPKELEVIEMDYKISWKGYKLTLKYGEDAVTYIPSSFKDYNGLTGTYALADGNAAIDDIYEISFEDNSNAGIKYGENEYDDYTSYINATISFEENENLSIQSENGNQHKLKFLYGETVFMIMKGDQQSLYSQMTFMDEISQSFKRRYFCDSSFYVGEELVVPRRIGSLKEIGFDTDVNLEKKLASKRISQEIVMELDSVKAIVKVINPYENAIPLKKCTICSLTIEDTTGIIGKMPSQLCGKVSYEEIENYYKEPYKKAKELLIYKGKMLTEIILYSYDELGEEVIEDNLERDISLGFKDEILNSIKIEAPELLYHGLQDNVDQKELEKLSQNEFEGIVEIRNDILGKLTKAFEKANIDAKINDETGEIVMDSGILFDTDEYELSEKGKEYVDKIGKVYAKILLNDEFSDMISKVVIEGHTDMDGEYDYNLKLSQKRAESVKTYCLKESSMNAKEKEQFGKILKAKGYAYTDPIFTEEDKVDKEASRRVAIKFFVNVK